MLVNQFVAIVLFVIVFVFLLIVINKIIDKIRGKDKARTSMLYGWGGIFIFVGILFAAGFYPKVYIIKVDDYKTVYVFGKKQYKMSNNKTVIIDMSRRTCVLNNDPRTLYLKYINYGNTYSFKSNEIIPSFYLHSIDVRGIDYIFEDPPSSILSKSGSKTKSWLHY